MQYLCEQGADKKARTNDGWTPLDLAAEKFHMSELELLRYRVHGGDLYLRSTHIMLGTLPLYMCMYMYIHLQVLGHRRQEVLSRLLLVILHLARSQHQQPRQGRIA